MERGKRTALENGKLPKPFRLVRAKGSRSRRPAAKRRTTGVTTQTTRGCALPLSPSAKRSHWANGDQAPCGRHKSSLEGSRATNPPGDLIAPEAGA
jgi:hypothetical protein